MAKYNPLHRYLSDLNFHIWSTSFSQLEEILGFPLPESARSYPAWWSNGRDTSQTKAWMDAGWRTEDLNLGSERITFRRVGTKEVKPIKKPAKDISIPESATGAGSVDIRVNFEWLTLGSVRLDPRGDLVFPPTPDVPGLYRFNIIGPTSGSEYVGETERLSRRFAHYRNPGPSQTTNIRINALMLAALTAGANIDVAVVTSQVLIEKNGVIELLALDSKIIRCLAENAAIMMSGGKDIESLNRAKL